MVWARGRMNRVLRRAKKFLVPRRFPGNDPSEPNRWSRGSIARFSACVADSKACDVVSPRQTLDRYACQNGERQRPDQDETFAMIPSLPLRVLTLRPRGFVMTNEALELRRRAHLLALTNDGARQDIVGREAR